MQNISTYETDERSLKPKRKFSSSSSSTLLPQDKCICCDKTKKYKSNKVGNLRTCNLNQVKEKIEQCAKDKADHRIIALISTHDLIAAEAKYHPSCYANFTRPKITSVQSMSSGKCQETDDYKRIELEVFKIAVECCFNTINQSKVFKFQELPSIMTTHLRKNDLAMTPSTRKNLRRYIEKCFGDKLKFFTCKERLYVYSAEIDVGNLVKQLFEARKKCTYTVKTPQAIHNEIKELKDGMPWPPKSNDLQPENFKMAKMLGELLATLLQEKIATIR